MPGLYYDNIAGQTEYIEFDALTDEAHNRSATATSHPVEDGSNVSDHIRAEQHTIAFRAVVTNKPSRNISKDSTVSGSFGSVTLAARTAAQRLGSLIVFPGPVVQRAEITTSADTTISAVLFTFSSPFNRVESIHEKLISLLNSGTLMHIDTTLEQLDDMALIGIEVGRDAGRGNVLDARLTFTHIRKVSTSTVVVPESVRAGNRGGQATTDPNATEEARAEETVNSSFARQLQTRLTGT